MINLTTSILTTPNVKRVLGEYYIDIDQETNKKRIVDAINNFINQKQFHNVISNEKNLVKQASISHIIQLPNNIFINFPSNSCLQWMSSNYNYRFLYDTFTKKIFFCVTTSYHNASIYDSLNERFGLATLRKFYKYIVLNNVSISLKTRYIKEINKKCEELKYIPKYIGFKIKGSNNILLIKDVQCDGPKNDRVTLRTQTFSYHDKVLTGERTEWWSYEQIKKKLLNEWIPTQMVDIREVVEKSFVEREQKLQLQLKALQNEKERILESFN